MSYFKSKIGVSGNSKTNDTGLNGLGKSNFNLDSEFYETEPGVVLDIILDENHPAIKNQTLDVSSFPENYKNKTPNNSDLDCTWIGRVLVRLCFSQQGIAKEKLNWAIPLDVTGVVEYPLINETVVVIKYFDSLYYTKRLNFRGFINNSANYKLEKVYGINSGNSNTGPISLTTNKEYAKQNSDYTGILGKYFITNNKMRRLKKFEGDTSIESRFGQSIRFATYDNNRKNDEASYIDYKGDTSINPVGDFGGGNPMILIRNRQRRIGSDAPQIIHPKLPPIPAISKSEKNVGGLIEEDINHDGSSIHITSGLTVSKWKPTVYKSMFGINSEEQSKYSPANSSKFKYPILNGDQIVINTDRIILNSRFGETFHYSKKRYGIVTDAECSIDANDQIVLSTNTKTVINSPLIYLGQYNESNEPAILGQTCVNWLYDLCEWLEEHTHWYKHTHPHVGNPSTEQTQLSIQIDKLTILKNNLNKMLSRRVFLTGGGFAPGANGVAPVGFSEITPTVINVSTGEGVPNGFKGVNKRL